MTFESPHAVHALLTCPPFEDGHILLSFSDATSISDGSNPRQGVVANANSPPSSSYPIMPSFFHPPAQFQNQEVHSNKNDRYSKPPPKQEASSVFTRSLKMIDRSTSLDVAMPGNSFIMTSCRSLDFQGNQKTNERRRLVLLPDDNIINTEAKNNLVDSIHLTSFPSGFHTNKYR